MPINNRVVGHQGTNYMNTLIKIRNRATTRDGPEKLNIGNHNLNRLRNNLLESCWPSDSTYQTRALLSLMMVDVCVVRLAKA